MGLGHRDLQALQGAKVETVSQQSAHSGLSPLLDVSGAVKHGEAGVASHYGQPIAEARALEEGRAFVDYSHGGVVTITGSDRLSWLHSMTSQKVDALQPGQSAETLVLNPQGRVEHALRVVDDGERSWLLLDGQSTEALLGFLQRMRFALRVDITDVTQDFAQLVVTEGSTLEKLRESAAVVTEWVDQWAEVAPGGFQYARDREYELATRRVLVPRGELSSLARLVSGGELRAAGLHALDALEVHAGRPTMNDVDERSIPHEFDWMRTAVHLDKGCYRGQETVAKVHNLGRPPRRFVILQIDGSGGELPEAGALIYLAGAGAEDRPVGRITRSALHHEWGELALALLKRNTAEDAQLEVQLASGVRCIAQQEVLVPADAGAARDVPRLPRLG